MGRTEAGAVAATRIDIVQDGEQVKPLQWLDEATVLVSVRLGDTVHLVAWDYRTGELGHVRPYPASFDLSLRELDRH